MGANAGELFERHRATVFRFIRRSTGSADLAEDLTQEVFLRVLTRANAEYVVRSEASWLFQVARNVVVDHYRRGRVVSQTTDRATGTLTAPAGQLLAFGLQEALDRLPAQEREALLLREQAGFSYAEIAEICRTTEDAVSARLYRARRQLQRLLSPRLSIDPSRGSTRG